MTANNNYNLNEIIKDSDYKLSQFSPEQITNLQNRITIKKDKNGNEIPYIKCLIRDKEIKLTPEEISANFISIHF